MEHIGSAHDDAQLAALAQIAKERITGGQLAFDLDALTPTAPTGDPQTPRRRTAGRDGPVPA